MDNITDYTVNVDSFVCINLCGSMKMGSIAFIKIHVQVYIFSLIFKKRKLLLVDFIFFD